MNMKKRMKNFFGGLAPLWFEDDPGTPPGGGGTGSGTPPAAGGAPAAPAAPTAPAAPAAPAAGGKAGDPPTGDPFYKSVPTDWRDQLAAAVDPKNPTEYKSMLERYTDLPAVIKAAREAQQKIHKGIAAADALPDTATDEERSAWRKAKDIPDTPENYKLTLPNGITLSEADDRIVKGAFAVAHKHNVSTAVLSDLVSAFTLGRAEEAKRIQQQDNLDAAQTIQHLQDHWGSDFQVNDNLARAFVAGMPETIADVFANARGPDGKALLNHPEIIQYMADAQRKINPMATVINDQTGGGIDNINSEISKLEAKMGEPNWHDDTASQKRLMQLYDVRDAVKKQTKKTA
jgi:hypothetical protein